MTDHAPLTDEELARAERLPFIHVTSKTFQSRLIADLRATRAEVERLRICRKCGHDLIRQHDPEDGTCDAFSGDLLVGVCPCGRDVERLRAALRRVMDVGDRAAVRVAHEALGDEAEWKPV